MSPSSKLGFLSPRSRSSLSSNMPQMSVLPAYVVHRAYSRISDSHLATPGVRLAQDTHAFQTSDVGIRGVHLPQHTHAFHTKCCNSRSTSGTTYPRLSDSNLATAGVRLAQQPPRLSNSNVTTPGVRLAQHTHFKLAIILGVSSLQRPHFLPQMPKWRRTSARRHDRQ